MESYNEMITINIPQDYILLASVILIIIAMVRFLHYMASDAESKKKRKYGYRPVEVSKLNVKVKEKTIFLEDKINDFLESEQRITLKEWRKMVSQARGFKILVDQRGRAIKDCHAFIKELDKYLYVKFKDRVSEDKKYAELMKSIKATNKTRK